MNTQRLKLILGRLRGGLTNAGSGLSNGWKKGRTGHSPTTGENLPPIFNRMTRVGETLGKHPARWAVGGAAAVGGAGAGVHAYRSHDPEWTLGLGGRQGKRLIPEAKINAWLRKEVDPVLPGYTLSRSSGVWHGQREPSLGLTYFGERREAPKMRKIANSYVKTFKQDSAMLATKPARVRFIGQQGGAGSAP